MRKITNNAKLGKFSMLLNLLILVSFIISMVMIMKFDEVNVKLVADTPSYEKGVEKMREVEKPRRQALGEVEYYEYKLDTLKQQPIKTDAKLKKLHEEEIARTIDNIKEKKVALNSVDSVIKVEQMFFEPIQTVHKDLEDLTNSAKDKFLLLIYITIFLVVLKITLFGIWNMINIQNLRVASPWMKKSTAPYWAILGWFIPIYNFIKPYSVFAEIWDETDYILKDKEIVPKETKEDNSEFYIGLWWGLLIIAMGLMSWVINSTFFAQEAMYTKLSHSGVAITAIIAWAIYLAHETILIRKFNKMNQLLFANQSKL